MITTRRAVSLALRTTAIAAALVLLSSDPASACHKRKAKTRTTTTMAYGCATAPVTYGTSHGGYYSVPMPSHQGAYGVAPSPYSAMPAPIGYGMGQGRMGQVIYAPGRVMRGLGQAMPGGFGRGGMSYGTPGVYGPAQMGTYGPGMGGGYRGGIGY